MDQLKEIEMEKRRYCYRVDYTNSRGQTFCAHAGTRFQTRELAEQFAASLPPKRRKTAKVIQIKLPVSA